MFWYFNQILAFLVTWLLEKSGPAQKFAQNPSGFIPFSSRLRGSSHWLSLHQFPLVFPMIFECIARGTRPNSESRQWVNTLRKMCLKLE